VSTAPHGRSSAGCKGSVTRWQQGGSGDAIETAEIGGAAAFLAEAEKSNVTLFV
jgi:hypothetical protein